VERSYIVSGKSGPGSLNEQESFESVGADYFEHLEGRVSILFRLRDIERQIMACPSNLQGHWE